MASMSSRWPPGLRIAKPGAELDFSCSSCDLQTLAESVSRAGFADIETDTDRYSVRGRKP